MPSCATNRGLKLSNKRLFINFQIMRNSLCFILSSAFFCAAPWAVPVQAAIVKVTVTSPQDVSEVPVSVLLPKDFGGYYNGPISGQVLAAQSETAEEGKTRLTFIAPALKAGEKRAFFVETEASPKVGQGVELKREGENVNFLINGQLFTRYDTTTGPNKPYFYPVMAPTGAQIVRHWPLEKVTGDGKTETSDHPHHRGLWFTHGEVNGTDFWTEVGNKVGKTVNTGYGEVRGGPVYGLMQSRTDWIKPDAALPDGIKIAEDNREVRVYALNSGTLLDFSVTVKAVGGPLVFGDTKEGSFALRLADSMRVAVEKGKTAEGHILNSEGDKDAKAWGKSAAWCDYYGPVDGKTVGVAIFDEPKNPHYPTTWHVRDYGLFAVNPFGWHDFDKKKPQGAGDLTVPENQSVTFRYRVFFHNGTTEEANVPQMAQAFASPPLATVN